ncbi:MAG TPA: LytTR family DNA-binding domain-containing protein [Steroidobacteraceae bacterium]|jgi:hypothetical protein
MDIEPVAKSGGTPLASWLSHHQGELITVFLVFIAYATTIWVAFDSTWIFAVLTGAANTVPFVIFAALVRQIILKHLIGRKFLIQTAWHAALCFGFSVACYWLILVMLAVASSPSAWNFQVKAFVPRGAAWQLLENVTTYALVAALSYLQAARAMPASLSVAAPFQEGVKAPPRLLVRVRDELRPIDLDRIVTVSGADDYAEVTSLDGKHLVTMTLAQFEGMLDPARFVRVHRSHIINHDFIDRAEPAGAGRLLLHMRNGTTVSTSRAGAQLLKSRVI